MAGSFGFPPGTQVAPSPAVNPLTLPLEQFLIEHQKRRPRAVGPAAMLGVLMGGRLPWASGKGLSPGAWKSEMETALLLDMIREREEKQAFERGGYPSKEASTLGLEEKRWQALRRRFPEELRMLGERKKTLGGAELSNLQEKLKRGLGPRQRELWLKGKMKEKGLLPQQLELWMTEEMQKRGLLPSQIRGRTGKTSPTSETGKLIADYQNKLFKVMTTTDPLVDKDQVVADLKEKYLRRIIYAAKREGLNPVEALDEAGIELPPSLGGGEPPPTAVRTPGGEQLPTPEGVMRKMLEEQNTRGALEFARLVEMPEQAGVDGEDSPGYWDKLLMDTWGGEVPELHGVVSVYADMAEQRLSPKPNPQAHPLMVVRQPLVEKVRRALAMWQARKFGILVTRRSGVPWSISSGGDATEGELIDRYWPDFKDFTEDLMHALVDMKKGWAPELAEAFQSQAMPAEGAQALAMPSHPQTILDSASRQARLEEVSRGLSALPAGR